MPTFGRNKSCGSKKSLFLFGQHAFPPFRKSAFPTAAAPTGRSARRNATEKVWAATRIAQGWRFGPERNDARKEHPCLIPYEELPEEERTYDRQTALETLKLIEHLGFEIRKR